MEPIMTILRYILLYITLLGGSIFISYKSNKKIENCIAPNFAIIILILYVFGIFNILKYGVWVVTIANILLGIYAIARKWKNKEELKQKLLTPGLAFFSIAFFVLLLTTYNKNLMDYDHYLYRSLNTKIMYYTDCINKGFQSLYPPSINLLEYFFMKVIGAYIQGVEAFAVQLLGFSLLIPLFDRKKNSKFINTIITIVVIGVPAILANLVFYEAAYPDALLGLIIGYSMYILCEENNNKFKIFAATIALSVATITKPAGIVIAALVIAMYLLIELLNNKCNKKEKIKKFLKSKEFKNIVILSIIVLTIFASWKVFTKINSKYSTASRGEDASRVEGKPIQYVLKSIATTTFGYYEENHDSADSNNNLIPKLYSLYATMSPVRLTLYGSIVALIIAAIMIYKYIVKKENKTKFANQTIAFFVGLVAYTLFLQLSYILKFSTEEMLGHNGLNRYMPTFLLGMLYFIIAIAIKNMEEKETRRINYIILITIIIACTPLQSIANVTITSGIYNIQSIEYCNNGRIPANDVNEKIEKDAKIICISGEEKTNIYSLMFRYYMYPEHQVSTYVSTDLNEKNVSYITGRILKDNISYIYTFGMDEKTEKLLTTQFNLKVNSNCLYKIEIQEENVNLIEIPLD